MEKQSGSTITATPVRSHQPEVPTKIDRLALLQTMLNPGREGVMLAMPDQEGTTVQDNDIRSGREVCSCA